MTVAQAPISKGPNSEKTLSSVQKDLIMEAGLKIAPSWPLDQMIAVNPFWALRDQRIEDVSAQMSAMTGGHLLMPKEHYLAMFENGSITPEALSSAAKDQGVEMSIDELLNALQVSSEESRWRNLADLSDGLRSEHKMAWKDEIVHQISQFCAAHYQNLRPLLNRAHSTDEPNLYQHWLDVTRKDRGIGIVLDEPGLSEVFKGLPDDSETLLAHAIEELQLTDDVLPHYAHRLLLDINGWASWVAYLKWQGELYADPRDEMLQLLAIRTAWELAIWRHAQGQDNAHSKQLSNLWAIETRRLPTLVAAHLVEQRPLWVWAKAVELSYQDALKQKLLSAESPSVDQPKLQAAFCIDVRSEVMRRALEAESSDIQTLGFAGFFGLPLEYQPHDTAFVRPQLPGLLKPALRATETHQQIGSLDKLNKSARWQTWSQAAPSAFAMVESTGWLQAFKLLKKSFFTNSEEHPVNQLSRHRSWVLTSDGAELTVPEKAQLAKGVLHAMGLTSFAPTVLLVGHGSHTTNNLHAAGLDCGACGGQTGEVNVRVLASLLNDVDVRQELKTLNVDIPETTHFVAAVHNTTTDHITCFSESLTADVKAWLSGATKRAQRERMVLVDENMATLNDDQLDAAFKKRSNDWSQVRPEWGLANNAAFIVAPRQWTKSVNLEGRSFLHDYQWQNDDGFAILELIMTAPMIVTNWINMQYNASVTDNFKFGSGNKLLHNAVGGNIGLFEGNGGDLRIGLALQSLHNGKRWMHQPQRLAVYLAAPREPIEAIANKHDNVKHLIDNEWLYVYRWSDDNVIERFYKARWV